MCLVECFDVILPGGHREPQEIITPCVMGSPGRACNGARYEQRRDQYAQVIPIAIPIAGPSGKAKPKRAEGLRLEFELKVPFTSTGKSKVTLTNPVLPARASSVRLPRNRPVEYVRAVPYPAEVEYVGQTGYHPAPRVEYVERTEYHTPHPQPSLIRARPTPIDVPPMVVAMEPRTPATPTSPASTRPSTRRSSPPPPITREHTRRVRRPARSRSRPRVPEPQRRNQSRGRLHTIDRRLEEVEATLRDARRYAEEQRRADIEEEIRIRHDRRIASIVQELRELRLRRDREAEEMARFQEQEDAHQLLERERLERLARHGRRGVDVHQPGPGRGRPDGLDERGDRFLAEAVRAEREEARRGEEARRRGGRGRGDQHGVRRRGTGAQEQIVWDDGTRVWARRD